jgi:hypothetical protein
MRAMKGIAAGFALSICGFALFAQAASGDAGKDPGPYMGQTPPGVVPAVFAPGIISVPGRYTYDMCLGKDGRECYFTVRNASWSVYRIMVTRYENGKWTEPAQASFSSANSMSPSLADSDQTMYFCLDNHIGRARRTAQGWSAPERLPAPLSSASYDYSCSISDLGNAWICSHRSGGLGQCDLWRVKSENGRFTEAVDLRDLNTMASDCSPVTGPDEAYVLWYASRPGGFGGSDIYISYADGSGGWKSPENLGPSINTSAGEYGASLSADKKYLFFTRGVSEGTEIYWVSVDAFLKAR